MGGVAEALRQRYRFNARIALRYAHGWSQRQAADEWNKRFMLLPLDNGLAVLAACGCGP